jgi:ribosomal-protein-alanine N-acetyltransferase
VVWFGESLDPETVDASVEATRCDVFFTIGTSAVVYPAAGLIDHARRAGALTVEINPDSTPASGGVDVVLPVAAEAALTALDAQLGRHPLVLVTPRLRLEPVLPRVTPALHAVWVDPQVRRFLWDDKVIPIETAAEVTGASARDFDRHRFGLWSVITRDDGRLAGFCGLRTDGVGDEPELLFGLLPDFWGRGLAREAARAVLAYAFDTLHLARVIAATDVPNQPSARTLLSLGMRFERRASHHGLDTLFYGLTAADLDRGA